MGGEGIEVALFLAGFVAGLFLCLVVAFWRVVWEMTMEDRRRR